MSPHISQPVMGSLLRVVVGEYGRLASLVGRREVRPCCRPASTAEPGREIILAG
jgi:hypothetical protein